MPREYPQQFEDPNQQRRALQLMGEGTLNSFKVADMPIPNRPCVAFAIDGRKTGEGAGAGTGVLCYFDGVNWRRVSDDSTVVA